MNTLHTTLAHVLVIDDDPAMVLAAAKILDQIADIQFAPSAPKALELLQHSVPDLIILDAFMQGTDSLFFLKQLKTEPALTNVPIIFTTATPQDTFEEQAFSLGAADFIVKPYSPGVVRARVQSQLKMKHFLDQLQMLSYSDQLTGLYNRHFMRQALEQTWTRSTQQEQELSILMIDIDYFKHYNDHFGHPAGDLVLKQVAQCLSGALFKPSFVLSRHGGEEFLALLPNTSESSALSIAKQILAAISALKIPHAPACPFPYVSISIGVATHPQPSTPIPFSSSSELTSLPSFALPTTTDTSRKEAKNYSDLVEFADLALYQAKHLGRAQACAFTFELIPAP